MSIKNPTCFFAFPSQPPDIAETIDVAIDEINGTEIVDIISWQSLRVTGKVVIHRICEAISDADIFICDLTTLNPNVLFELGFAIGLKKRIWVTLNDSYPAAKQNYENSKLLSMIGYTPYVNSFDIVDRFLHDEPYSDLDANLYADLFEGSGNNNSNPHLFYLKCLENTNSSSSLSQHLENSSLRIMKDDPDEVTLEPMSWYVENVTNAHAVVGHLLDQDRSEPVRVESAKYS